MSRLVAMVALISAASLADIPPDDAWQCEGKGAGTECVTTAGAKGVCTSKLVPRWDYSQGLPPKTIHVEEMICLAPVTARGVVPRSVVIGLFLAFLAGLAALGARHRPA